MAEATGIVRGPWWIIAGLEGKVLSSIPDTVVPGGAAGRRRLGEGTEPSGGTVGI